MRRGPARGALKRGSYVKRECGTVLQKDAEADANATNSMARGTVRFEDVIAFSIDILTATVAS